MEVVLNALLDGGGAHESEPGIYSVCRPNRCVMNYHGDFLESTWFRDFCSDEQLVESVEDIRKWADYDEEQARENER